MSQDQYQSYDEEEYDNPTNNGGYGQEVSTQEPAEQQPEVNQNFSKVATTPGKNIAILVIIVVILSGMGYMILFSEDEVEKEKEEKQKVELEAPIQPSTEELQQLEEPPAPETEVIAISSPVIDLPDLPPLAPPDPPAPPPQARITPPPVTDNKPTNIINTIISEENPNSPSQAPVSGSADASRAVESLIFGGGASAGGGEGGAAAAPQGGANVPDFNLEEEEESDSDEVPITGAKKVKLSRIKDIQATIAQGKVIDAVLETAINTDLVGDIRAVISRNVYSEQGRNVLIPRGSRLIGNYFSEVARGQTRVQVSWTRIIRPDGMDFQLEGGFGVATDRLGRAGLPGKVDNRYAEIFGSALLISMITTSAAIAAEQFADSDGISTTENTDGSTRTSGSATNIAVTETISNVGDVGKQLVEELIKTQPTISIDQGTRIKVFVQRDLVFPQGVASNVRVIR